MLIINDSVYGSPFREVTPPKTQTIRQPAVFQQGLWLLGLAKCAENSKNLFSNSTEVTLPSLPSLPKSLKIFSKLESWITTFRSQHYWLTTAPGPRDHRGFTGFIGWSFDASCPYNRYSPPPTKKEHQLWF